MNQPPKTLAFEKSQITGVIFAAGGSKRLGRPKQGLKWQGKPFITQIALQALAAGLAPLKAVVGAEQALVRAAVGDLPVDLVENPDWEEGQSTSMKVGLRALPSNCDGVVFLLGDQPQVSAILIRKLVEQRATTCAPIIAPRVGNQRSNPVLFGRETFQVLFEVTGDKGGRGIFDHFEIDYVLWMDKRLLMDIDDNEDIRRMNQMFGNVVE
jgi:molybdenum cofactor cytidylyltransferase